MSVCGTGSGNFPQPGDPSTSIVISAQAVLGGILVSWQYPNLNPQAVAHFNLYRSTSVDPATKTRIATATGSTYMDYHSGTETGITYYYWVEVVSVHGTVGDLQGPASAEMRPIHSMVIESIAGKLTQEILDNGVKTQLGQIDVLNDDLVNEIANREYGTTQINDALGTQLSQLDAVDTLLTTEIAERTSANSALLAQVDVILAKANDNEAAIVNEQLVRVTENEALATQINTVQANVGDNSAAISSEQTARADADGALATSIDTLAVDMGNDITAAIQEERTVRVDAEEALAESIDTLDVQMNDPATGLSAKASALEQFKTHVEDQGENGFLATASYMNQIEAEAGDAYSWVQSNSDVVAGVSASYVVKSTVNGYATGFGLYNENGIGSFRLHVDYFSLGKPDGSGGHVIGSGVPPFVMSTVNGQTSIALNSDTFIADAAIKNAMIANASIDSANIRSLAVEEGHLKNAAVDTLKIAGEAVTVPLGDNGGGGSVGSSERTVCSAGDSFGSVAPDSVIIQGAVNFSNNSGADESVRLHFEDSTGNAGGHVGATVLDGHSISLASAAVFTGSTGYVTFSMKIYTDGATVDVGNASMAVLGAKR